LSDYLISAGFEINTDRIIPVIKLYTDKSIKCEFVWKRRLLYVIKCLSYGLCEYHFEVKENGLF
jgi:hypothetical protein